MENMISGDLFDRRATPASVTHIGPINVRAKLLAPDRALGFPFDRRAVFRRNAPGLGPLLNGLVTARIQSLSGANGATEKLDRLEDCGLGVHDHYSIQEKLALQDIPAVTPAKLVSRLCVMETIHARIKRLRLRETLDISLEELARRVGVSYQTCQQWESGKTAPKRARIPKVAAVLGVTENELLFGDQANKVGVESPPEINGTAAHLHQLSDEEIALLKDWRELLPEKREPHAKAIQRDADEARAYKAMAGDRRGNVVPFSGADRRFNSGGLRSTETRRTMHTRFVYQGGGVRSGKLGERTIGPSEIEEMSGGEQ